VGLIDVAMPAWEGVSTVCDQANATMKAIASAPTEKTSLRIVGSFVGEFDAVKVHASCFRSLPSRAKNGVVARFVGFAGSRSTKRLHEFARKASVDHPNTGENHDCQRILSAQKDSIRYLNQPAWRQVTAWRHKQTLLDRFSFGG
jgi:hypothetical protein